MLPAETPSSFQTYSPCRSCLGIFKRLLVSAGSKFLLVAIVNSSGETGSRPGPTAAIWGCKGGFSDDVCVLTDCCFKLSGNLSDSSSANPTVATKSTAISIARKVLLALKALSIGEETRRSLQIRIAAVSTSMALAQR